MQGEDGIPKALKTEIIMRLMNLISHPSGKVFSCTLRSKNKPVSRWQTFRSIKQANRTLWKKDTFARSVSS